MFNNKLRVSIGIDAVVRRADGSSVNLGRINSRFPWRTWLYRLGFIIQRAGLWLSNSANKRE